MSIKIWYRGQIKTIKINFMKRLIDTKTGYKDTVHLCISKYKISFNYPSIFKIYTIDSVTLVVIMDYHLSMKIIYRTKQIILLLINKRLWLITHYSDKWKENVDSFFANFPYTEESITTVVVVVPKQDKSMF